MKNKTFTRTQNSNKSNLEEAADGTRSLNGVSTAKFAIADS